MADASVRIAITADDQSSAAIQQAQTRILAFKAASETAGAGMATSMREARGAVMLLGEEVGVRLNRHVAGFVAGLPMIGAGLQAAFAPLAIFALVEVLNKVFERIDKIKKAQTDPAFTKSFQDWQRQCDGVMKKYIDIGRAEELLGKSDEQKAALKRRWAAEDAGNLQAYLGQLQREYQLQQDIAAKGGKAAYMTGGAYGMVRDPNATSANEAAEAAQGRMVELEKQIHAVDLQIAESDIKKRQVNVEITKELEKHHKHLETAAEKLKNLLALQKYYAQQFWNTEQTNPLAKLPSGYGEGVLESRGITPDQGKADQYLQRIKDMKGWYDETRTAAERYNIEVAKLDNLFSSDHGEVYQRAMQQLQDRYKGTTNYAKELGAAFTDAAKSGLLMGRSWSDVMKSLSVTIAELIVKMTLLKALNNSDFFGNMFGGFLFGSGGIFGGAMAAGGSVTAGTTYLVGETGPELFTPRTSGTIIPNGAGGVTYNIDARGADAGAEMRIRRALQETEDRAVMRAVETTHDINRRR
jgi:hypothetical protein